TKSLTININGKLDLGNSHVIVDYTGASPIDSIRAALLLAYTPTAHWTGNGLTSSTAAANSKLALGYAEASDALGISGVQTATFAGQSVDATSVLVRLTLNG